MFNDRQSIILVFVGRIVKPLVILVRFRPAAVEALPRPDPLKANPDVDRQALAVLAAADRTLHTLPLLDRSFTVSPAKVGIEPTIEFLDRVETNRTRVSITGVTVHAALPNSRLNAIAEHCQLTGRRLTTSARNIVNCCILATVSLGNFWWEKTGVPFSWKILVGENRSPVKRCYCITLAAVWELPYLRRHRKPRFVPGLPGAGGPVF